MSRLSHRVTAWLGLFAMLMVFLGPLIGQGTALARDSHAHQHGSAHAAAMAEMDCGGMPGMADMPHAGEHHGLALWEKCGYCSLLFQHPPLLESGSAFIASSAAPALFASVDPATRPATAPVFPGARSRAPPSIR